MTVNYDWFDELDSDSSGSGGSLDAYIDVAAGSIQVNADQMSSANFDGGIPKADPTNVTATNIKRGDYVYWNLASNTPITSGNTSEVDDDSNDAYDENVYLVLDIEYSDEVTETPSFVYLYLDVEGEPTRVQMGGTASITVIRESSPENWDGGSEGWLLTASGNAIFSNVLVRGTVDASIIQGSTVIGSVIKTSDITDGPGVQAVLDGTGLSFNAYNASEVFTGKAINFSTTAGIATDIYGVKTDGTLTSYYIRIDPAAGDVGGGSDTGIFNVYNGPATTNGSTRLTMDNNEMQSQIRTSGSWIANGFSINPFGGNVNIATSSGANGNLQVGNATGSNAITVNGSLSATGTVNFSTTGTVTLGSDGVEVNISAPSGDNTGRALNVGGNAGISQVFTNQISVLSATPGYIIVNDTAQFNGFFYCPDIYNTQSGSSVANVRVGTDGRLLRIASTQDVKEEIYNLSSVNLSSSILESKISTNKIFDPYSVLNISSVSYKSTIDSSLNVGFIIEDIYEKSPELVDYDEDSNPIFYNINGIVASMLVVMQDQQSKIKELENRLAILEG